MEEYLYNQVKRSLVEMNLPKETCSISFFVNVDEENKYAEYSNLPEFAINYAMESDLEEMDEEDKWNWWI